MSLGRFDTSSRDKPMSEINMTPLVDVMLVLVAILIITAPLLASRIALDLPKADGAAQAQPQVEALHIALQADGALYLDDQPVSQEALTQLKLFGERPADYLFGCAGGGSNLAGQIRAPRRESRHVPGGRCSRWPGRRRRAR